MRPLHAVPATALALAVASLGLVAPAHAATRHLHDGRDHGVPAAGDILSMSVDNGHRAVKVTLTLADVSPTKAAVYALVATSRARFTIGEESSGHGTQQVFVRFTKDGDAHQVHCSGAHVRLVRKHDAVDISVPQHCLGAGTAKLKVSGLTEDPTNGGDEDSTKTLTVPRG